MVFNSSDQSQTVARDFACNIKPGFLGPSPQLCSLPGASSSTQHQLPLHCCSQAFSQNHADFTVVPPPLFQSIRALKSNLLGCNQTRDGEILPITQKHKSKKKYDPDRAQVFLQRPRPPENPQIPRALCTPHICQACLLQKKRKGSNLTPESGASQTFASTLKLWLLLPILLQS